MQKFKCSVINQDGYEDTIEAQSAGDAAEVFAESLCVDDPIWYSDFGNGLDILVIGDDDSITFFVEMEATPTFYASRA